MVVFIAVGVVIAVVGALFMIFVLIVVRVRVVEPGEEAFSLRFTGLGRG
jgi:hypothetical protein